MINFENPYEKELQACQEKINEYEAGLVKEHERKNSLLSELANFYTIKLQGTYYKNEETGKFGQIEKVFFKSGKYFAHVYYLDVTVNSKVRKMYTNIEFDEIKKMTLLTEEEYKDAFFHYVNQHLEHRRA